MFSHWSTFTWQWTETPNYVRLGCNLSLFFLNFNTKSVRAVRITMQSFSSRTQLRRVRYNLPGLLLIKYIITSSIKDISSISWVIQRAHGVTGQDCLETTKCKYWRRPLVGLLFICFLFYTHHWRSVWMSVWERLGCFLDTEQSWEAPGSPSALCYTEFSLQSTGGAAAFPTTLGFKYIHNTKALGELL